jgi:hypothetical protein
VLFDDYGVNSERPNEDADSLVNLIEAEWELEQIFRTAPNTSNPQRLSWMMTDEDMVDDQDGWSSQFDPAIAEKDMPRLGYSPQELLPDQRQHQHYNMQQQYPLLHHPSSLLDPQIFAVPPSRARNPVPLNTPFQASLVGRAWNRDYITSPFYPDLADGDDPIKFSDLTFHERSPKHCSSILAADHFPDPASPPASGGASAHMRRRNRSYSDSMLKRDEMCDVANNSVVLVS